MSGDLIYPGGHNHLCKPPLPAVNIPQDTVWVCECGNALVKTRWDYIPETWRNPHWWECSVWRTRRKTLKQRRIKQAEEEYRRNLAIVDSYKL